MKKIFLLMLCLLMLLSSTVGLVSCKDEQVKDPTNVDDGAETQEMLEEEGELYEDLVKEDYSTDGTPTEFKIVNVSTGWSLDFMDSDSITIPYDSAVYSRNRFVEEQLGIVITANQVKNTEITSIIRTAEQTGDYFYDVCYTNVVVPHAGQQLYFADACVDMLYTHEDLAPRNMQVGNSISLVYAVNIAGQKITITNDAHDDTSNIVYKMYGDTLKTDFVQIAHHGYNGGDRDMYLAMDAKVALCKPCLQSYRFAILSRKAKCTG